AVGIAAFRAAASDSIAVQVLGALMLGAVYSQAILLFHDCLHGSALRSARANLIVGEILGGFFVLPFGVTRRAHLRHHKNVGLVDGDPEHIGFRDEEIRKNALLRVLSVFRGTPLSPLVFL